MAEDSRMVAAEQDGRLSRAETYAAHRAALPGAGIGWLDDARNAAMDAFARTGMPTRRMERWKYVDLRALAETDWRLVAPATAVPAGLPAPLDDGGIRVVLVDGRFRSDLSQGLGEAPGLTVGTMGDLLADGGPLAQLAFGDGEWHRSGPLVALNTAMAGDGVVVSVTDGAHIERPLEILHWTTAAPHPGEFHARHALLLGRRSRIGIVERFMGAEGAAVFASHGCAVGLEAGAELDHVRVQQEAAGTIHVAATRVALAAGSAYRACYVGLGAATARIEVDAVLAGEGAELDLAAAYLARGGQQSDLTTSVRHATRNGRSAQLVKGVADGRARGVFQGVIVVDPGAQRSDARQYSRAMLLSPQAEVDTKPELRIHADDVQCAHGAAIGELDADQLFYLRARGIAEAAARAMLVEAFVAEVVERAPVAAARPLLAQLTADWLGGAA